MSHSKTKKLSSNVQSLSTPKLSTLLRLLSYLKPYWWALLLVIVGFAINASTEIGTAKLLQYITDAIKQSDQSKRDWFPVLIIMLFLVR
ncbi:MAG: lipid ABC transporter permease/ATP-binding protein, partial [Psychrobacter sp.]